MASGEGSLDEEDDQDLEEPRASKAAPAPRRKKRRVIDEDDDDDDDETPIAGGHYLVAAALIGAAAILPASKVGEWLEPRGPEPTHPERWNTGVNAKVRITLVTADYNLLGCAAAQEFDGVHCAHKSPTEVWPRTDAPDDFNNKVNIVQPYRTWFDNKLVFVAGLWATPEVAYRLHSEPPQGQIADKLARFAVECDLTFVGRFDNVKLRWNPNQNWVDPDAPAWVGRAKSCRFIDEPQ